MMPATLPSVAFFWDAGVPRRDFLGGLMRSKRPPISAAIICYNEQDNIERCLDALSWCEQIVIVDSGSSDRTLDLVKKYDRTEIHHRDFDNYIDQKNCALDHCQHDWVISIDADEVLTPDLIEEIAKLPFDVDGYYIGRRTFLGEQEIKHGTWNPDYNMRLFRRTQGRWGGSNPHERVLLDGSSQRLATRLLHYSFRDRDDYIERSEKYTHMIVGHFAKKGRKTFFGEPLIHWVGNFFKSYILRRGFLDGSAGFFIAYHGANFSYTKYSLLARQNSLSVTAPLRKSA